MLYAMLCYMKKKIVFFSSFCILLCVLYYTLHISQSVEKLQKRIESALAFGLFFEQMNAVYIDVGNAAIRYYMCSIFRMYELYRYSYSIKCMKLPTTKSTLLYFFCLFSLLS